MNRGAWLQKGCELLGESPVFGPAAQTPPSTCPSTLLHCEVCHLLICARRLKLTQTASQCRFIKTFCVRSLPSVSGCDAKGRDHPLIRTG